MHDDDWWFAYDCILCPAEGQGIVLDLRAAGRVEAPVVECPFCKKAMYYKGTWLADADGYGSRGDSTAVVNLARAAAALERAQCARECRLVAESDGVASLEEKARCYREAATWCAEAIERRRDA